MPKCENCYHYDLCEFNLSHQGIDLTSIVLASKYDSSADDCPYFKDESLIMELPCKVGETVYILEHVFCSCVTPEVDYYEIEEVQFEGVSTDKIWLDGCDYDRDEVGKIIFFTREEAEKALEGRKNENT